MAPGNQLALASIINTVTGESVSVMYNPEELKLEQGNNFAEVGIPGLNAPPVQYVRGKARVLTMELFFDTYETGEDVRAHTAAHRGAAGQAAETQAPPVLLFSIGRLRSFGACSPTPGSGSRCSCATARRCAPSCRCACRSTCSVAVEIEQGLFFGSPTVSAAVNAVGEVG